MSQPASRNTSQINWASVITVISAAILIGAEVFGAAYAGGWAVGTLFGFGETGQRIFEALFFAGGLYIMYVFIRTAQTVEPFTSRR